VIDGKQRGSAMKLLGLGAEGNSRGIRCVLMFHLETCPWLEGEMNLAAELNEISRNTMQRAIELTEYINRVN
jgi:hypothetical protein